MDFIEWKKELETGFTVIDVQHKKLVEMINTISELSTNDRAIERDWVIEANIMKLIEYTNYHFETEEQLFEECKYDKTELHKTEHNNLRLRIQEIYARFAKQDDVTEQLLGLLKTWLTEHIMGSDMKYVNTIKEHRPDLIKD